MLIIKTELHQMRSVTHAECICMMQQLGLDWGFTSHVRQWQQTSTSYSSSAARNEDQATLTNYRTQTTHYQCTAHYSINISPSIFQLKTWPGLGGTRMSSFWILLQLRVPRSWWQLYWSYI